MSNNSDSCKIWVRFESKRKDGSVIKLRIQDLPEGRENDALDFTLNVLQPDEAFHRAAGISTNLSKESSQEYLEMVTYLHSDKNRHVTICCIDNDSADVGQILGLSVMQLKKKEGYVADFFEKLEIKSKEIRNMFHIISVLEDYSGPINYDTYYDGRGMAVHPDYRGLGIANEIIKVRKMICVDKGIPMTCAWMTALGTQKAAEKCNWKTFAEISLEELDRLTGLTFEKKVPTYKYMYTTTS